MAERSDLKYVTDIMPEADADFRAFEGRYFSTPKKMGAQTAEANINAGWLQPGRLQLSSRTVARNSKLTSK